MCVVKSSIIYLPRTIVVTTGANSVAMCQVRRQCILRNVEIDPEINYEDDDNSDSE